MPKLSVIIPVLSAGEFLTAALDSVLQQSLREIEVVCVNYGSADDPLSTLENYRKKDSRIIILQTGNCSMGEALNEGIKNASGEYVHFLFPGEYVFNYAYEALYNKAVKYETDFLRCAVLCFDPKEESFLNFPQENLSKMRPGDFGRLLSSDKNSPIYKLSALPEAGIYRRDFLIKNDIFFSTIKYFSERTFFYQTIANADKIMVARDRLVCRKNDLRFFSDTDREEYLNCCFLSVQNTVAFLDKVQADMDLREAVLTVEFENLISCLENIYKLSDCDHGILIAAYEFIQAYEGSFSYILTAKFRKLQKKLLKPETKKQQPKQIGVFYQESDQPKVSVVVPIYNVEDYLNESLNSLTAQTLKDIEFICVNDGSTDNSLVILKEYAVLDKRFRIFDGPNGGYGKAMNRGIDAARGKYLGILEPDDFVPVNMFAELYKAAEKNQVDLVKADFYRFRQNPDGSRNRKLEKFTHDKSYYRRIICPDDEQEVFNFAMNTWSGIYNLEFLRRWNIRHNETPGAAFQDNGFWFQTFCRAERVMFLDTPFYSYRTDNPGSSENNRKVNSFFGEYEFIWDWMEKDPVLTERFEKIYYSRKFNALIRNYWFLAPEYQQELLHRISEEFRDIYDHDILNKDIMMSGFQWNLYNKIIPDPDGFFENICVSVIMPVYNSEKYLRQALDGILALNEIPFELICVDDGSYDSSPSILREYEERDFRVRVITQKNLGAGVARNTGMRYAKGEYLFFPDSDDLYDPEILRNAYSKAISLDADIIVFRSDEFHEETGEILSSGRTIRSDLIPSVQPFAGTEILQDTFRAFIGWPWDKLFRRKFIIENNLKFQEIRTTNDLLFVFSAVVKAKRIGTLEKILVHHRVHSGSLSVTRGKSWHCFFEALCALKQQLISWDMYGKLEQDYVNYSLNFCLWHLKTLHGNSYFELYDFLKKGGLEELGLLSHEIDYFYSKNEYLQLQAMIVTDAEDFLFIRYAEVNDENKRLLINAKKIRADFSAEKKERKELTALYKNRGSKIRILRKRNADLKEEIVELKKETARLKKKCAALKKRNFALKTQNNRLRRSETWKAGCVIMWLPKKIKNLFKKLRRHD